MVDIPNVATKTKGPDTLSQIQHQPSRQDTKIPLCNLLLEVSSATSITEDLQYRLSCSVVAPLEPLAKLSIIPMVTLGEGDNLQ